MSVEEGFMSRRIFQSSAPLPTPKLDWGSTPLEVHASLSSMYPSGIQLALHRETPSKKKKNVRDITFSSGTLSGFQEDGKNVYAAFTQNSASFTKRVKEGTPDESVMWKETGPVSLVFVFGTGDDSRRMSVNIISGDEEVGQATRDVVSGTAKRFFPGVVIESSKPSKARTALW